VIRTKSWCSGLRCSWKSPMEWLNSWIHDLCKKHQNINITIPDEEKAETMYLHTFITNPNIFKTKFRLGLAYCV